MFGLYSLQADSDVEFAARPMSWRPPGATDFRLEDPGELSHRLCALEDRTKISSWC